MTWGWVHLALTLVTFVAVTYSAVLNLRTLHRLQVYRRELDAVRLRLALLGEALRDLLRERATAGLVGRRHPGYPDERSARDVESDNPTPSGPDGRGA